MKKLVLLALCAISAFYAFGYSLQSFKEPKGGDAICLKNSGRLSSVDVFSTASNGTVELSRVFSMPFYTNSYDTTEVVTTNIVKNPVNRYEYVREGDGVVFTNSYDEWYTPTNRSAWWDHPGAGHQGRISFSSISGWWYSTEWDDETVTYSTGTKCAEAGKVYDVERLSFSMADGAVAFNRKTTFDHWEYTTNVVHSVVTNSVTKHLAYDLVVTNLLIRGTCEDNCFHGTPSPDAWIFPGDKLIFTGTATGGALRIVIE